MSRLYIWHDVEPVSSSYHENGALLVVARTVDEARSFAHSYMAGEYRYDHPLAESTWLTEDPDLVLDIGDQMEPGTVIVHPDAGCC